MSLMRRLLVGSFFTHHQKTVIVDTPVPNAQGPVNSRTLLSFVGGIDLCNHRYDDQHHTLFR